MVEVYFKPQLKPAKAPQHTPPIQSLTERLRDAVQVTFNGDLPAQRAKLHGLRINLRNMAIEIEKMELESVKMKTWIKENSVHGDDCKWNDTTNNECTCGLVEVCPLDPNDLGVKL